LHPDADAFCRPLTEAIYITLDRDPEKPFAKGMGIPVYFRCISEPEKDQPLAFDIDATVHSVIFVLVEDNLEFVEPRADYIAKLYAQTPASAGQHLLVPVALAGSTFNLPSDISKANFVRLFNLAQDPVKPKLIHYIVHALARLLDNTARPVTSGIKLSPLPIKLFISHTKRDPKALELAKELKQELDNTQVNRFFDSVDIASGHNFDEEIEGNIENSAFIAIRSDGYFILNYCHSGQE
jgi:hypothetical protein